MERECPYIENCPIFNKFKAEGLKNFWIALYCKGRKMNECERKKLRNAGEAPPPNLLPNGKLMEA